jgi:hypothetical protein
MSQSAGSNALLAARATLRRLVQEAMKAKGG